jgi:putative FmdB family regulatory protein
MPLYEYRCTGCGNVEERLQTIAERNKGIGEPVCCSGCDHPFERIMSRTHLAGEIDTKLCRDALKTRDMLDLPDEYDREKILIDEAKRRGVSTTGKWYDPQLATYEGDPMAWVPSLTSRPFVRYAAGKLSCTMAGMRSRFPWICPKGSPSKIKRFTPRWVHDLHSP